MDNTSSTTEFEFKPKHRPEFPPTWLCSAVESTEFLCDRSAHYLVQNTALCHIHARRYWEAKG